MTENMVVFTCLIVVFLLGVSFDRYLLPSNPKLEPKPQDFFSKQKSSSQGVPEARQISIDDKKIVIGVNTDNMTKHHDGLGTTISKEDDTKAAISKLKNMKGK